MNELYFGIKDSMWRTNRPSAYYFDDLCEFLTDDESYDDREGLLRDFIKPLCDLFRKKYELIKNCKPTSGDGFFILEIPTEISGVAKPAMKWYIKIYPEGDYMETAVDFLSTLDESDKNGGVITISGE